MQFNMSAKEGKTNPVILSSTEIRQQALVQPEDVISGLLRKGEQILIYSSTGSYKSWLGTAIWLAVSNGSSVAITPDGVKKWKAPKPRKVLLVDGELDQADLGDRLNRLVPNYGEREGSVLMRQAQAINSVFPNLADPLDQDALIRHCDDSGIELVVLDNLTTLAEIADENATSAVKPLMNMLLKLKAAGIATVLIHHSNKNDSGYRGSSSIATTFNAIIKLQRIPLEKGQFKLMFEKARNQHIENQAMKLTLKTLPDLSLRLEADPELSYYDVIVGLVRTRDYERDDDVRRALEVKLDKAIPQSTFATYKKAALKEELITLNDWNACLKDAKDFNERL